MSKASKAAKREWKRRVRHPGQSLKQWARSLEDNHLSSMPAPDLAVTWAVRKGLFR